jgi:aerobic-type carbon monoxide dehydrogenase small subunit (CoxS/CutS family)
MATELKILVNEKSWTVEAAPDTTLLYVLSNELRLQGPRFATVRCPAEPVVDSRRGGVPDAGSW